MDLLFCLLFKVSTSRDGAFEKGGYAGDHGGAGWGVIRGHKFLSFLNIVKRSLLSKGGLNVTIPLPAD